MLSHKAPMPPVIVRKKRPDPVSSLTLVTPRSVLPQAKLSSPRPSSERPLPPQATTPVPQLDPEQPSKRQRQIQVQYDLLAVFRERWPQIFPADFQHMRPFALGIHQEMIEALPDTKPFLIRRTLFRFQRAGNGAYWRAILKGGPRYALDGTPKGEVTAEEQGHAKQQIAAIAAWRKVKREGRQRGDASQETPAPPGADSLSV